MQPGVSIIILNWNGIKDTIVCLESVYKLDYPNFEVIVVDNGSTDNSVKLIRNSFPKVSLIENIVNLGYAGGNNVGMRYAIDAGAKYVWLLNNDTVVAPDSLSELIRAAKQSDRCGLLSPVIYYYDEPQKIQFNGSFLDWVRKRVVQSDLPEPGSGSSGQDLSKQVADDMEEMLSSGKVTGSDAVLWGTALLIKREAIMSIGYLNEKYFSYHEDIEYSVRAINCGFTNVVVSASKIFHKEASSSGGKDSPFYCYFMTRNIYYFWRDNLSGLDKIFYLRNYLSDSISRAGSLKKKKKHESVNACMDGIWSALRGVTGPWNKNIKMPSFIKRILLAYPFFWVYLLRGEYRKILVRSVNYYDK